MPPDPIRASSRYRPDSIMPTRVLIAGVLLCARGDGPCVVLHRPRVSDLVGGRAGGPTHRSGVWRLARLDPHHGGDPWGRGAACAGLGMAGNVHPMRETPSTTSPVG